MPIKGEKISYISSSTVPRPAKDIFVWMREGASTEDTYDKDGFFGAFTAAFNKEDGHRARVQEQIERKFDNENRKLTNKEKAV